MTIHRVSSLSTIPKPETIPLKLPVSILAFLQLGLSVIQATKSITTIIKDTEDFHSAGTK
jgi:hypothetical protein